MTVSTNLGYRIKQNKHILCTVLRANKWCITKISLWESSQRYGKSRQKRAKLLASKCSWNVYIYKPKPSYCVIAHMSDATLWALASDVYLIVNIVKNQSEMWKKACNKGETASPINADEMTIFINLDCWIVQKHYLWCATLRASDSCIVTVNTVRNHLKMCLKACPNGRNCLPQKCSWNE